MRRVNPRVFREPDDRGAVAVLVAVLLAGGVLIGAAALVVDVGGLYAKREQLQSGADAAAWAVAEACIGNATCTSQSTQPLADDLMARQIYGPGDEGNAASAAAAVQVCVDGIDCAAWNTAVSCPAQRLSFGEYAEVRAYYQDGADLIMPAPLAGAFSGEDKGARVGACSRVSWGAPESLPATALGLDRSCVTGDYRRTGYPTQDRREALTVVPLQSLPEATAADTVTCATTTLAAEGCAIEPTPPQVVETSIGDGSCAQAVAAAQDAGEPLVLPVYETAAPPPPPTDDSGGIYRADDSATATAADAEVTVVGFAAFRPTACDPVDQCQGYFTRVLAPRAQPRFTVDGNRDYGVTVIGRTG